LLTRLAGLRWRPLIAKPEIGHAGYRFVLTWSNRFQHRNPFLTMFKDDLAMKTRDDLKAVIEALRKHHGLLAAYLEAVEGFDWEALSKPVAIVELAAGANLEASRRINLS
jgi:hypothetical protein